MTRTFADFLPMTGGAAPLLTAAIATPYPAPLSELAKKVGISKFAASRAAVGLVEAGLLRVTPNGRGHEFNDDHEFAASVCLLAWRASGVHRGEKYTPGRLAYDQDPGVDFHYRRMIPDSLGSRKESTAQGSSTQFGPNLLTARDLCTWMSSFSSELLAYEHDGQEVWSRWSNERLRDIVHQTLHFGGALGEANEALVEACDASVQGDADPRTARTSAHAWVRAAHFLSAETQDVLRVVEILDQAIWVGGRVNTLRARAIGHLNQANYAGIHSPGAAQAVEDAAKTAEEADALWRDESYGPYKHIGGTPRPVDVGSAGDQILAVRLLGTATALSKQVAVMAEHPSIQAWTDAHPQESTQFTLLTGVPNTLLRGTGDWPAEPPRPQPTKP